MKKELLSVLLCAALMCSCSSEKEDTGYYEPPADKQTAASAVDEASSDDTSSETEPKDQNVMYDVSPIVEAYHSGDLSALDDLQTEIYNKAVSVLDEIISEDMTDYEKELAIHDYIVNNCQYDSGALRAIPKPSENSDNPYGVLINGQSICKGYTTTFRMFMGMLGISCGTVHSADIDGDEHAWNTVELDGSWYYVDVTWDDPVPDDPYGMTVHEFFNVSRDKIAERHVLPEGSPDTDSLKYTYASQSVFVISDLSQIDEAIKQIVEKNNDSVFMIFSEEMDITFVGRDGEYISSEVKELDFNIEIEKAIEKYSCEKRSVQIADTDKGKAIQITLRRPYA